MEGIQQSVAIWTRLAQGGKCSHDSWKDSCCLGPALRQSECLAPPTSERQRPKLKTEFNNCC
eukprot:230841-Amphidinium_carterae.1